MNPESKSESIEKVPAPPGGEPARRAAPSRLFPWRDRWFVVLLILYLAAIGCLWGVRTNATMTLVKVTPFDTLALPEERVQVGAKFEVDGPGLVNPDVDEERVQCEFPGNWHAPTAVETDEDGHASVEVLAPALPRTYAVSMSLVRTEMFVPRDPLAFGRLFVLAADTPIIVTDIDGTITAGRELDLAAFGDIRSAGPTPLDDAPETLTALSARHVIVYLTARDDGLLNNTRGWLAARGFPTSGPLVGRDWKPTNLHETGAMKLATLRAWTARFRGFRWGIGNTDGDCLAYREAGIPHVTLGKSDCKPTPDAPRCVEVKDWAEIRALLLHE